MEKLTEIIWTIITLPYLAILSILYIYNFTFKRDDFGKIHESYLEFTYQNRIGINILCLLIWAIFIVKILK